MYGWTAPLDPVNDGVLPPLSTQRLRLVSHLKCSQLPPPLLPLLPPLTTTTTTTRMMRVTPFGGDKVSIVALVHRLFEDGVLSFFCGHGPFHIRFLPPVGVLSRQQFDEVMDFVEAAIIAHGRES